MLQHSTEEFSEPSNLDDSLPGSSFLERVSGLPLVRMVLGQVQKVYEGTKERNGLLRSALETGERTVYFSLNTANRILESTGVASRLQKPLELADASACFMLDKVEGKVPIITKTPYEIKLMARQKYEDTVDNVTTAKENTANRVRDGLEEAKRRGANTVDVLLATRYGQQLDHVLERTISTLDHTVDKYLPEQNGFSNGKVSNGYTHSNGGPTANGGPPKRLDQVLQVSHKLTRRVSLRIREGTTDVVDSILESPPVVAYRHSAHGVRERIGSVKKDVVEIIHGTRDRVKHVALKGYVMMVEAVGNLVTVSHSILLKVLPTSLHEPINLALNRGVEMLNKHVNVPYVDVDE